MYSIDLILKLSPMSLSVQRKEEEDAENVYQTIINAMKAATPQLLKLTCEKQTDKKIAVFSDQISAVVVSEKSGTSQTGRAPGFLSVSGSEAQT